MGIRSFRLYGSHLGICSLMDCFHCRTGPFSACQATVPSQSLQQTLLATAPFRQFLDTHHGNTKVCLRHHDGEQMADELGGWPRSQSEPQPRCPIFVTVSSSLKVGLRAETREPLPPPLPTPLALVRRHQLLQIRTHPNPAP